ncbi:MAG TPA: SCO2322 family protein [Acidothermaceae bacterium]
MTLGRRFAVVALAALAIVVGVGGFGSTAHAATAYRYWTYYVAAPNTATWSYSQRGPATEHPQDGEVQGWRFAVQADRSGGLTPRVSPEFAKLCPTQPAPGKVRVGVVLDFGVPADAPAGERPPANVVTGCVQVVEGASGVDVLDAAVGAANVRIGQGLICGIDGYPKHECAVVVTAPAASTGTPAPAKTPTAAAKPPAGTATTVPASQPPAPSPTTLASASASASAPGSTSTSTAPMPSAAVSGAPPSSASASPFVSTLTVLHKPSHSGFPTGAVIGVALVFGLAIAAVVRGSRARR